MRELVWDWYVCAEEKVREGGKEGTCMEEEEEGEEDGRG
jgi:hypothetical protein